MAIDNPLVRPGEPEEGPRGSISELWDYEDAMVLKSASKSHRENLLLSSIRRWTVKPEFNDLILECGGKKFLCHKAVVCAQSGVLRVACRKAPDSPIRIRCHPLVLQMALTFFYLCDYRFYLAYGFPSYFQSEGQTVPADYVDRLDCCELSLHLQVHVLANHLRISGLRYLSAFKALEVLHRASFPIVFPRFVREVYKTVSKQNALLRRTLVKYAAKVLRGSASRNHFDSRFPKYILHELPEFEHDLETECIDIFGSILTEDPRDDGRIAEKQWVC